MDNIESHVIGDEEEQQADLYETGGGVLRLRVISPDGQILLLEGISAGESVQAIRSALAEQPLTAHLTSFDLILEPKAAKSAATAHGEDAAADASIPESLKTAANAAEAAEKLQLQLQQQLVSVAEDGTVELNDVLELSEYACVGLESGSTVRMSRSPYDARSARFHLRRFHDLLKHPPAATASSDPKDPTRAARMQTIQQAQATGFEAEAAAVAVSDAVKEQQNQHFARSQAKLLLVEAGGVSTAGLEACRLAAAAAAEEEEEARLSAAWTKNLVGLHEQAQQASKRLERHRKESDRIVCARMPLLEPCSFLSAGGVGSSPSLDPNQPSLTLGGFELGLSAPHHGHGLGLFFPKVLNAAGLDYCGPSRHLPPDQAALPALAVIDAEETAKAESLASSSPAPPPLLSKEQPLLLSKVQQQTTPAPLQQQLQPKDDSWIDVDSKAAAAVGSAASSSKADRKKQQNQKRGGKGPAGNNGHGSSSSSNPTSAAPRDEKKHNSASSSPTSSSGALSGVGESNDDSDDGGDSGDSDEDVENGAGGGGGRECVRYVCTSAFGPPSPQRRLAGDLVYLEVGLLDPEGLPFDAGEEAGSRSQGGQPQDVTVVHVTGTARGWFVNGSTTAPKGGGGGGWFDPRPRRVLLPSSALPPASSSSPPRSLLTPQFAAAPELHGLLVLVSPVFRRRWRKALKAAAVVAAAHEDPLATIAHMVVDGRLDSVVVRPSWCLPNLTGTSNSFTSSKTTTATTPLSSLLAIGPAAATATEGGGEAEGSELESRQAGGGFDGEGLVTADRFRCEEDLSSSSVQDDYRGALRDWNEEFQCYHELPCSNLNEKLTRAKMIYKVWSEFQEASVVGAAAIASGQVPPINPTEPPRSHVFVFNNTFFSYGVDSKDANKVLGGDEAAAKSARHDMRNVQLLEQFAFTTPPLTQAATAAVAAQDEKLAAAATAGASASSSTARLCTLATALVDLPCVGRRVVCQSIIPGILSGDQLSKLVYGAIEHGVPLHTDAGMQTLLRSVAERFHLATREMPSVPIGLADGPLEGEGQKAAATAPAVVVEYTAPAEEEGRPSAAAATVVLSGAVEMKGIVGTDERKYVLDLLRLTPRDANFVPRSAGGTGKWEDQEPAVATEKLEAKKAGQAQRKLADDDHAALLRPELIQRWRRRQQEVGKSSEEAVDKGENGGGGGEVNKGDDDGLNVNVFMPFESSVDQEESRLDEAKARQVACWLWDKVLPALTHQVRKGTVLPLDGSVLVEVLHSFGVNVRYLGRLAALALEEEQKDRRAALQSVRNQKQQQQQPATTPTPPPAKGSSGVADAAAGSSGSSEEADGGAEKNERSSGSSQNQNSSTGVVFPLYWRRLLEVEMVSRASKHVLRRLFDGLGPHSRQAPASTLAAFLNGLFGSGQRPTTAPASTSYEAAAASSPSASSSSSSSVQEKKAEATSSSSSSTKKKKKKNGGGGSSSPTGAAAAAAAKASVDKNAAAAALKTGAAAADDCGVLSAEYLEFLSSQVLADPPTLPLHQCSSGSVWALIADEVRARYHHELLLWPNPHLLRSESGGGSDSDSGGAVDNAATSTTVKATWFEEHWGGPSPPSESSPAAAPYQPVERHHQWAECCATKPTLLRRVVARLGLRVKAKRYDWSGEQPFKVSDLIEAVPVPKSCAGASSPPGWSRALFQRQGPLAWLNSGDDSSSGDDDSNGSGKSDAGGGDNSEEAKSTSASSSSSSTSQALKPLPFGTGAGCGSGGGLGCLVPCPLGEVDELLAVAQVQALARSWESVYELAQQAFALAQATCGPLHRSTALALELVARALFNLGDPEVAVAQQTKALAIHEQLGGFDTPDVAAAHAQLALYHHKLGSLEAVPRHVLSPPADASLEHGGEASNSGEAAAGGGGEGEETAGGGEDGGGSLQMRSCVNLDRRLDRAARHMAAAAFLFELLGGPLHPEAADAYSKLGQFYHEAAMTATHHGFTQSSATTTDTAADGTGTGTDQAAKTAAATHKKGNGGSSNNGGSSSRRGPRPNRKSRAQRKSQSQLSCPLQQGAVELAVSALRCYREGLRRQTFGSLGLRCGAEQADDDDDAAAEVGSVVVVPRSQPWLTSVPAFTVLKGSGPSAAGGSSGSGSGVPVLGDEVLQFVVAETAQLVRDANATAAAATASAASSSVTAQVAPPLSGGAAVALPSPSALSATTAVTAAALNQTALLARIMQAQALHAMALAYERPLGMFKEALKLEKTAYKVYRLLLGEKHHLTATSEQFMRRFTDESVRALNASKQKKLQEQRKQQHQKQLKQQGRH